MPHLFLWKVVFLFKNQIRPTGDSEVHLKSGRMTISLQKTLNSYSLCALAHKHLSVALPPPSLSLHPPGALTQSLSPSNVSPPTLSLFCTHCLAPSTLFSQTNWSRWPLLFSLSKPLCTTVFRHLDYIAWVCVCVCARACACTLIFLSLFAN